MIHSHFKVTKGRDTNILYVSLTVHIAFAILHTTGYIVTMAVYKSQIKHLQGQVVQSQGNLSNLK